MTRQDVEKDLEGLPPPDELLEACSSVLAPEALAGIRELELNSSELLGCLWAELLQAGVDAEELFRKKGIIK